MRFDRAQQLSRSEHGLAVAVTMHPDGRPRTSVVNAGVPEHPRTGEAVIGFASLGNARKLGDLRHCPDLTVVFRSGWEWLAAEGTAQLVGPDDLTDEPGTNLPALLRAVYAAAAGGSPNDWSLLDEQMAAERHTAVLLSVQRWYPDGGAR